MIFILDRVLRHRCLATRCRWPCRSSAACIMFSKRFEDLRRVDADKDAAAAADDDAWVLRACDAPGRPFVLRRASLLPWRSCRSQRWHSEQ